LWAAAAVAPFAEAAPSPCVEAFKRGALCLDAGAAAQQMFVQRNVSGAIVVEDVLTGAIVVLGSNVRADEPKDLPPLDAAAPILPLSVAKLFLAASVWQHQQKPNLTLDQRLHDMLVHSSDDEGRHLAGDLRSLVDARAVLKDLASYGFPPCATPTAPDDSFWSQRGVPAVLVPASACASLDEKTDEATWANAFSLGEANFTVTLLHLVRFVQAIGNNGVRIAPGLNETPALRETAATRRVMPAAVSAKLQSAMRDVVEIGTAKGVKACLRGDWGIGGKTGSSAVHGEPFDGIFVGLIYDGEGTARYAFATYVRNGGFGGGAAAEISCDLFNFTLGL
jgi:membrane peptidoglycan carboxypeptidase